MKDYWQALLPFSPDTSGFCSVINATNGCGVIDDPQGCVTNYLIYEEDRSVPQRVFNSQLNNMDVIFGSEEKLLARYEEAGSALKPSFVLLGGSPVSALIGSDLSAAARDLQNRYSKACAPVALTGDAFYHEGVRETYLSLAKLLFEDKRESAEVIPHTVNLLGCCPMDIGASGGKAALEAVSAEQLTVLSRWGGTCTFDELKRSGKAEMNLVISADAVPLAEYLKSRFGTPWKRYFPFMPEEPFPVLPENTDPGILILGEPFISRGIAEILVSCGSDNVLTAGFFRTSENDYDVFLKDESDLFKLLKERSFDIVIGDPEFASLIPSGCSFVPLIHRAVSGLIHKGQAPETPDDSFWKNVSSVLCDLKPKSYVNLP